MYICVHTFIYKYAYDMCFSTYSEKTEVAHKICPIPHFCYISKLVMVLGPYLQQPIF